MSQSNRVFFSVDVETSGLTPWTGHLLTVGVEAVRLSDLANVGEFYVRLAPDLQNCWFLPEDYSAEDLLDRDTFTWWQEQDEVVRNEAWLDKALVRHNRYTAARMLAEFVIERAPQQEDRVFVANPVAFDKMWIDYLFTQASMDNPFHYRSLCLRSMKYGLRPHSEWGSDRENHAPKIPHHALWDAKAQAEDLRSMLSERDLREAVA